MIMNFLFSIGIVMPIFIILLIGVFLKQKKVMTEEFVQNGTALVFKLFLPANLFKSIYDSGVHNLYNIRFILFCLIATFVSFILLWIITAVFVESKPAAGAIVHGAIRGNFALLGLPLITNIVGVENTGPTILILAFVVPFYSILATIILTVCSKDVKKISIYKMILIILKNPLIIGIILGLIVSFANIPLPDILYKTIGSLSSLATPLALICLGGSLDLTKYNPKIKYAIASSVYKVVIQPIIFVSIAMFMGFRSYELITILIMFAVPTAVSSYAMTVQMKGDGYIASATVLITTLFSVFTLTIFIYVFRSMGII